jgi:hypothetical protein
LAVELKISDARGALADSAAVERERSSILGGVRAGCSLAGRPRPSAARAEPAVLDRTGSITEGMTAQVVSYILSLRHQR